MRTGQVASGERGADAAPGRDDGAMPCRRDAGDCRRVLPVCFLTVDFPTPHPNPSSHRQVLALAREGAKYGVFVVAAGAIFMVKKVHIANVRVQPMRARAGVHTQTLRPRAHTVASRR